MGQGSIRRPVHVDVEGEHDDGLIYDNSAFSNNRRQRPKSIISRIKDKIIDARAQRRESSKSRSQSPVRHTQIPERRRSTTYQRETTEPAWAQPQQRPEYVEVDYDDSTDSDHEIRQTRSQQQSRVDENMIEALQNAVEIERRNVRVCKQKLSQASRQNDISSAYLQRIIDQLKQHESTLATATRSLQEAQAGDVRSSRRPRPTSQHPGVRAEQRQRQPQRDSTRARTLEDDFFGPFGGFSPFASQSRHPDPIFRAFEDLHSIHSIDPLGRTGGIDAFEHLFQQTRPTADDAHFRFFSMPGGHMPDAQRKRQRHSTPTGGFGAQQARAPPEFTTFQPPPPPQPPTTMLTPDEAKRLFKTYNDRWNSLPGNDPDIPFPARGLHAGGLAARDSIWAPHVSAHVATWSDETVMQANAQAFFLGVVGLTPQYTQNPGTGRIECGFDKSRATLGQVKELTDILKKEKTRWHSDRLGRRNGGSGAPNERLQKDERARAVFHAVCELMESAQ